MSRILIFSRTTDYRHESIEHGAEVLTALLAADGHETTHTEDPAVFTPDGLAPFAVVVWLSTTGDVLDDDQRAAFARWLGDGGAFAGVHSATVSETGWPEFARITGATFAGHPDLQRATVHVADADHPSTAGLPASWQHTDEWYEFTGGPGADRTVLLTVDEATYEGGGMGEHHPIAWYGPYGAGRTWYTSLGHDVEAYDDPVLQQHLRGGLRSLLTAAPTTGAAS